MNNKKIDEVEAKAEEILQTENNVDKQQRLIKHAKELRIPYHSSDVHSIVLSYSEMFDRISEWIRNHRTENYTRRTVCASCISAFTAFLAVVVSLWINWQTRQLLAPTERPQIVVVNSEGKGLIKDEKEELELTLRVLLKNMGKNPADNMRIRVWVAPTNMPDLLHKTRDNILADPLFPDIQFTWNPMLSVPLRRSGEKFHAEKDELFFLPSSGLYRSIQSI